MKRILHISKYYPPYIGGIEQVCHMIISSLPQYQHEVICFNTCHNTVISSYEGIPVTRVGILTKVANQPIPINYIWHLHKKIKTFKPHIIHFHAPNPLISVYLLPLLPPEIKLIIHYHAEILTSKFLYSLYRPLEQRLFQRADLILATSPNIKNEAPPLAKYQDKCDVLANAINTQLHDLTPNDSTHIQNIKNKYHNQKIVLTYGRHVPYKGLKYLIEARKFIAHECTILIGGEGPLTPQLKEQAQNLKNIVFLGRIPNNNLKYYLHAADIFAFPSITKAEAFGVTLLESMYCYTPTVTFTIPASGVNYVTQNQLTGIEVENSNAQKFAQAIDLLLNDDKLRSTMAQAAHQRVTRLFSQKTFTDKVTTIYSNMLDVL